MTLLLTIAVAFSLAAVATPLARAGGRRLRLLDRPNPRSSHTEVTPRSGGLAVLAGLGAGLALPGQPHTDRPLIWAWAAGMMLVTLVGLLDDRFGLPPWPRLAGQTLAAALVVGAARGLDRMPLPAPLDWRLGYFGPIVAVVWIVAVVNFYNFMDGIDGLAALQAVVSGLALAAALAANPLAPHVAAALVGACAGFLLFNWSPASVFLGDAGSGLVGYTLATLPFLIGGERRSQAVALTGASLILFLADASACLLRRMARGERWYEAHREHLYQRWVRAGASHARVASTLGIAALAVTVVAWMGWERREAAWTWTALLLGGAALAAEWVQVRRLERRANGGR